MAKKKGATRPHPGRRAEQPWIPMMLGEKLPMAPELIASLKDKGMTDESIAEIAREEVWLNNQYVVHVTRRVEDNSVYELSIRRTDRKPIHDWRHLQRIKNDIAGPEVEAMELYPAMSRIMDTANQYFLWCMPPGHPLEVGFNFPRPNLVDADEHIGLPSEQRELPSDWLEYAEGRA